MTDTLSGLHQRLMYYDQSYPPEVLGGGPRITTLTPNTMAAGSGPTVITVDGRGFDADAVVEADGAALVTTRVSPNRLTAPFSPTVAGDVAFSVRNVGTADESNDVTFTVTAGAPDPVPTLSAVAPNTSVAGSAATPITVTGTGFVARSVIRVDGANRPTTYVSPTQMTASLTAGQQAAAATLNIDVQTTAPGGGISAGLPFTVTDAVGADPEPENGGDD